MLDRLWIQLAQVPETLSSNSCRLLFSISVPICTLKSLSLSSLCNLCAWQSIVRQLNGHCVWACLYRRDYVVMPPWNWSNETQIKIYSIYFSTDTKWHLRACGTSVFAITSTVFLWYPRVPGTSAFADTCTLFLWYPAVTGTSAYADTCTLFLWYPAVTGTSVFAVTSAFCVVGTAAFSIMPTLLPWYLSATGTLFSPSRPQYFCHPPSLLGKVNVGRFSRN